MFYLSTRLPTDTWVVSEQCCREDGYTDICLGPYFQLFRYIPSSGIVGPCGNSLLNFLLFSQRDFAGLQSVGFPGQVEIISQGSLARSITVFVF